MLILVISLVVLFSFLLVFAISAVIGDDEDDSPEEN